MALTRRAIRVYAALDGLKDHREEDALDALLPFMAPILQFIPGRPFQARFLVMGAKRLYGWNLTLPVAEAFQERLAQKGWLVRSFKTDRTSFWVCQAPSDPPPDPKEIAVSTAIDGIIDDLQKFAPSVSNYYNPDRSRDDLKDILIRFLVSLDGYSATAMAKNLRELDAEDAADPADSPLQGLEDGGEPLTEQDRYLCARFVKHLAQTNSPQLKHLTSLVAVGLLTEVVADFVKPTGVVNKSDLTVVLDAPLALDLLGTSGPAIQQDAENVLKSLTGIGCKFVVFKTSCDEMARALTAMLRLQPHLRHGLTHTAMLRGEVSADFVRTIAADPEGSLEQIGVGVKHITLEDYPNAHTHFSQERFDDFMSRLHWNSENARLHDAECVTLIMRLRAGAHRRDPLACNYVFVTGNDRLDQATRAYCVRERLIDTRHCGPVIHQRNLATAAWLRTGFAGEVILRGHLVAACERVLRIRREVIEKAQAVVEKARPERMRELEIVLRDSRSVTRLMDQAMGAESVLENADADRLLDDIIRATARQLEEQHRAQLRLKDAQTQTLQSHYDGALSNREAALAQRDQVIAQQARQLTTLERERSERQLARASAIDQAADETNRLTQYLDRGIAASLYVAAVLGIAHAAAVELKLMSPYPFLWSAAILVTLLSAYHLIQDLRQRPKRGVDDALSGVARLVFRRNLVRRGIVDLDLTSLNIRQGQIPRPVETGTDPPHHDSSPLPPLIRTAAARIASIRHGQKETEQTPSP
jgi:hypothetical protein